MSEPADNEALVTALLEELLEFTLTPEEVCRDRLDLLPVVRDRLQEFRRVQAQVRELFPPRLSASDEERMGIPMSKCLPEIPGYEFLEMIGSGGMGVVYKARQQKLARPVAIKMLRAGVYASPDDVERFRREAIAVARLHHPNIVQVYDVGESNGRPFFTMELLEGGSLAAQLGGVPRPAREAATLLRTLAYAVHAAHLSGIVHRDLKPANMLLATDGTPKIADFGLARASDGASGLTLTGARLGTPSYMAPEQALGQKDAIGPLVDVYALGAVLYEVLTGRPPFRGETPAETERQVIAVTPVSPSRLNASVPRDLETICLKCLHKEPERRYATAPDLAADLDRFLRGDPILARRMGRISRALRWSRRNPAAAALVAAGLLLLAGVTGAAVWYAGERARLQYEEELRASEIHNRSQQVNHEANDALDQAELHLKDLHERLDDPLRVHELLSDIDRWQSMVHQAQQVWQRALSACVGNEVVVAEGTRDRISAVQARLSREEAGYRLARELDDILAEAFTPIDDRGSRFERAKANSAAFFSRLGMDIDQADMARLTSAIMSSPIRFALAAGLDHWAGFTAAINPQDPQLARLLGLARAADPDAWRDRFRDSAIWGDGTALATLANEVNVERQSPTILALLGGRLFVIGANSTALYKQAVICHPRDFWLHLDAAVHTKEPGARVGLSLAACAIRPNSPMAYSNLSVCLREQGDWTGAVTAANRALAIDPNCVAAHNNLGASLRDSKDLAGAAAAFRKAIELDPKHASAYSNLGVVLGESQDLSGAVAAHQKAVELEPKSATYHNNLGAALRVSNDLPGAVAELKKAIELNPKYVSARSNLGIALAESGDLAGAIASHQKAVELDPKSAAAQINLGVALRDSKDLQGAITAFKKAIELNPKSASAQTNLGIALGESGDLVGALAAHRRAVELDPKSSSARNNLGMALQASEDLPGAVAAFNMAIELEPDHPLAYANLGRVLLAQGNSAGAAASCSKAIELDPKSALAHVNLGDALRNSEDWQGAVAAYAKAIELDPGRIAAYYGIGMTHQSQGHYADAERAYLRTIEAQPAFIPANNALARLLATCPDETVRDAKRAVEYATAACKLTGWKEPDYFDSLAAAYAEAGQFEAAIHYQTSALDDPTLTDSDRTGRRQRLELYRQKRPWREK